MNLEILCIAFSGLVIVAFLLGLKIGFGRRAVLHSGLDRCQEVKRMIRALVQIRNHSAVVDDLIPPFRCRPMNIQDAVKIADEALKEYTENVKK